jgi:cytochrome P450
MVPAWRLVNWAFDAEDDTRAKAPVVDVLGQTPPEVNTARTLADYWIARILGRPLPEGSRTEVIEFMAQGRNPDVRLRLSDDEVRSRLVTMVSLIALGPHALWR